MGSGKWPYEGFGKAAFMSSIQRQSSPHWEHNTWLAADNATWTRDHGASNDKGMYDLNFYAKTPTTGQSFCYLGGPGANLALGKWSNWDFASGSLSFFASTPVSILQRASNLTDLFVVDQVGKVRYSFWRNDDWSGFNDLSEWTTLDFGPNNTPKFSTRTRLAVVSRRITNIDVFAVAEDGKVYTAWWVKDKGWTGWRDISNGVIFGQGAPNPLGLPTPMAVVSRNGGQLDIFVNSDGMIWTAYWTEGVTDWTSVTRGWTPIDVFHAPFPRNAEIFALARQPQTMEIFLTGADGHVWVSGCLLLNIDPPGVPGLWEFFRDIGTSLPDTSTSPVTETTFYPGGRIIGVSRDPDRIDLFAVGIDQQLYTTHWTPLEDWSGTGPHKYWQSLGAGTDPAGVNVFDPQYLDLATVLRTTPNGKTVDVFVTTSSYRIYRTSWNETSRIWSSDVSAGGAGWDSGVGGTEIAGTSVRGFKIAATSRSGLTISVIAMKGNAVGFTDYEGL